VTVYAQSARDGGFWSTSESKQGLSVRRKCSAIASRMLRTLREQRVTKAAGLSRWSTREQIETDAAASLQDRGCLSNLRRL
jgi:hypothetical protein